MDFVTFENMMYNREQWEKDIQDSMDAEENAMFLEAMREFYEGFPVDYPTDEEMEHMAEVMGY